VEAIGAVGRRKESSEKDLGAPIYDASTPKSRLLERLQCVLVASASSFWQA
jgi:hypothetical protein